MHNFDPEEIYQRLIDIAKEDGIITADEKALLDNIRDNIDQYYQVLTDSYEDEVITANEQNEMYEGRKKILNEAIEVAKEDDTISQDEHSLLKAVHKILDEMEYHEHY